jgi:hypothetical protein
VSVHFSLSSSFAVFIIKNKQVQIARHFYHQKTVSSLFKKSSSSSSSGFLYTQQQHIIKDQAIYNKNNNKSIRTMASKKLAQTIAHSSKEGTTTTTKNVISQTLKKVAPWKITGPASDPEWQNVPVSAEDYRARAPASFPHENVKIPNSEPDRVFNVRYYPRDARRAFEPVLHGREKVKTTYTLSPTENVLGAKEWDERLGNDIKQIDPRDFFPGRRDASQDYALKSSGYRAVPLLENPGGGYTQL